MSRSVLAVKGPLRRFMPLTAPGRSEQEVERHLALPARPLLSLRASVSPLAVGENLLQGGPFPPIDGAAILGSHEHDLAGEPASILSR